jgi:hypothetical protein
MISSIEILYPGQACSARLIASDYDPRRRYHHFMVEVSISTLKGGVLYGAEKEILIHSGIIRNGS